MDFLEHGALALEELSAKLGRKFAEMQKKPLLDRYREALTRSRVTVQKLTAGLRRLTSPPNIYAPVIFVSPPSEQSTTIDYSQLEIGTKVKIISARHQDLPGRSGYIFSQPDQNGEVLVALEDGSSASLGIGLADKPNNLREIEVEKVDQRRVVIALDGRYLELDYPEDFAISAGDIVKLSHKTKQIVGLAELLKSYGEIATVERVVDPTRCEVKQGNSLRLVSCGRFNGKIEMGNKVVVDPTSTIIVDNLGDPQAHLIPVKIAKVTWEMIGGQDTAKKILRRAIEAPVKEKVLFEKYGRRQIRGALLCGPPGCGKTMLVKAVANSLAELYGQQALQSGFITIDGPEILRSLVGEAEGLFRQRFLLCRRHEEKYGYPAIMVINECEDILKKRGTGKSSDVHESLVNTFLNEMDKLEDLRTLVFLATNREDMLDPAVIRHGRINVVIRVNRPDQQTSESIFKIYLGNTPLAKGETVEKLAQLAAAELFSKRFNMFKILLKGEKQDQPMIFTYGHLASGAMIANLVNAAAETAFERDKANQTFTGVKRQDLLIAIQEDFEQRKNLDHSDDLKYFVQDVKDDVIGIQKLFQGRK